MNILFATYEAAPFFQTGGLGEVARSLPKALANLDINITLILPKYEVLKLPQTPTKLGQFEIEFDDKKEKINIFKLPVGRRISLYLVDHPFLNEAIEKKDKAEKFILYSKAISYMVTFGDEEIFGKFDIIHLNDWHSSAVSFFLKKMDEVALTPPTILTIHNLNYQGQIDKNRICELLRIKRYKPNFNTVMEAGITHASHITTVSPTYAKEIIHTKLGLQFQKLFYQRRNNITGILNGIDYDLWDPQTDKFSNHRFNQDNCTEGKKNNKIALQKELKLSLSELTPLVSFIGRLEPRQKGIDFILATLRTLLPERTSQFTLLGTGDLVWTKKIGNLITKYPKNIAFINRFDEKMAHKIYAASDIVLIPSKYEPCGLVQMIAMRYGTLPLVRKTGGLADTVKDGVNGFVFESYSPTALARTLRLALKLFHDNPDKIAKMRQTAMKEDFSWAKSAREYKKLYKKVIREKV